MKNGLNVEEVWPNELPGLRSSRDREGESRESGRAFEEEGAAAMAQSVPVFLPMAQTAPGQVPSAEHPVPKGVCVQPGKLLSETSRTSLRYF